MYQAARTDALDGLIQEGGIMPLHAAFWLWLTCIFLADLGGRRPVDWLGFLYPH